jgi:hypothetical protein
MKLFAVTLISFSLFATAASPAQTSGTVLALVSSHYDLSCYTVSSHTRTVFFYRSRPLSGNLCCANIPLEPSRRLTIDTFPGP